MPMLGAYSVSKAALLSMARALSFELADSGIRINTVCPGVVKTKFAGALVDMEDVLAQQFAMKRFGEPHEISGKYDLNNQNSKAKLKTKSILGLVSFLCDNERASYITGENYAICGGANIRL